MKHILLLLQFCSWEPKNVKGRSALPKVTQLVSDRGQGEPSFAGGQSPSSLPFPFYNGRNRVRTVAQLSAFLVLGLLGQNPSLIHRPVGQTVYLSALFSPSFSRLRPQFHAWKDPGWHRGSPESGEKGGRAESIMPILQMKKRAQKVK